MKGILLILSGPRRPGPSWPALLDRLGMETRVEALGAARDGPPREARAVLIDAVSLPSAGIEACRRLREDPRALDLPILFLLKEDGPDLVLACFSAGADDCLAADADPRVIAAHLEALIRRYWRGRESRRRRTLQAGPIRLDYSAWSLVSAGRRVRLTAKEFAILEVLAQRTGSVVTRRALMTRIRRSFEETGSHTLETHIANIRAKLGEGSASLLKTVHGIGYMLQGPTSCA